MLTDRELFSIWYIEPLRKLQEMPEGQAGFVILGTACFLYERYAVANLKNQNKKADKKGLVQQLASDFGIDNATATAFWDVIRNGMLHEGMRLRNKKYSGWGFRDDYPGMAISEVNGKPYLFVEPFKFADRVLQLWEENLDLLKRSHSFPWATVGPTPTYTPETSS